MLSDTMKQVRDAERQAENILSEADEEAAAIVERARDGAEARRREAEKNAAGEAKARIEEAERAGEAEKARFADEVDERLAADRERAFSKADEAADAVIAGLI